MGSLGDRADRRPSSGYLGRCPGGTAKIERRLCICGFAGRVGPVDMPFSYQVWRALPQLRISEHTADWQRRWKHKPIRYLNTGWVGGWNWSSCLCRGPTLVLWWFKTVWCFTWDLPSLLSRSQCGMTFVQSINRAVKNTWLSWDRWKHPSNEFFRTWHSGSCITSNWQLISMLCFLIGSGYAIPSCPSYVSQINHCASRELNAPGCNDLLSGRTSIEVHRMSGNIMSVVWVKAAQSREQFRGINGSCLTRYILHMPHRDAEYTSQE